jgi:hypothetical protein
VGNRKVAPLTQWDEPNAPASTPTVPVVTVSGGRARIEDTGVTGAYFGNASGRANLTDTVPGTPVEIIAINGRVVLFT